MIQVSTGLAVLVQALIKSDGLDEPRVHLLLLLLLMVQHVWGGRRVVVEHHLIWLTMLLLLLLLLLLISGRRLLLKVAASVGPRGVVTMHLEVEKNKTKFTMLHITNAYKSQCCVSECKKTFSPRPDEPSSMSMHLYIYVVRTEKVVGRINIHS